MVNSNPETVSTDYDTSDKLYFEPLTLEDVLNICEQEKWRRHRAVRRPDAAQPRQRPQAERRADHRHLARKPSRSPRTANSSARCSTSSASARPAAAPRRPRTKPSPSPRASATPCSCARRSCSAAAAWSSSTTKPTCAVHPHRSRGIARAPVLVDHFLEDATEVDVDCISDGETAVIGAIMEHIEEAGIHSGDSACVIPPFSLSEKVKAEIANATKAMARELKVIGLMNVQFAVQGRDGLRARSEPARVAHRAVRHQGHRRPAAEARRENHGRQDAEGTRLHRGRSCRRISA